MSLFRSTGWLVALLAGYPLFSGAQQPVQRDYPNRAIRVVVPYAAGGPMDYIGRMLNKKMAPALGQQLVIDNRPGAGGALGTDVVAKWTADGGAVPAALAGGATRERADSPC